MKCEEKRAYRSQAKARQAARWIKANAARRGLKVPTYTYECPSCGKWHLTTMPKKPTAA